jgi:ubiquinone/menaquinone biosynthesis C-methylase UbiE
MKDAVEKWINKDGVDFLREAGVKEGHIALDFGCGAGHYTIPAARVVGETGRVYAVDKDEQVLSELMKRVGDMGLESIEPIKTEGQTRIPLNNRQVDFLLLYDIIHLIPDRRGLYGECHRILRPDGLLSVYPKHWKMDHAGWGLEDMDLGDIKRELENANFCFEKKSLERLLHDDELNQGYILNFRREG